MLIQLDDEWAIKIDSLGNHQPFRYRDVVVKDNETKEYVSTGEKDWFGEQSFHPSIPAVIKWYIIPAKLLSGEQTITMEEYLEKSSTMIDYMVKAIDNAVKSNGALGVSK